MKKKCSKKNYNRYCSITLNPQVNVYYHRITRITRILIQQLNEDKNLQLSIKKSLIKNLLFACFYFFYFFLR